MSQMMPNTSISQDIEHFSTQRQAVDPRADNAARSIAINRHTVLIERVFKGIKMRVGVPVAAYRDIVIAARLNAGRASVILRHRDGELDVLLAQGEAIETARKAKAWAAFLGKGLVIAEASVAMSAPIARRTKRAEPKRRSQFARRRKLGVNGRAATVFRDEREIIARH